MGYNMDEQDDQGVAGEKEAQQETGGHCCVVCVVEGGWGGENNGRNECGGIYASPRRVVCESIPS
jgi:hypothetical protein